MSVKSFVYLNNLVADTERGPSPSIWGSPGSANAWLADFIQDPRLGMLFFEDWRSAGLSPASGSAANFNGQQNWYAYLDTNGVVSDTGIVGGGLHMAASTTAHQGVALGSLTNNFQFTTVAGSTGLYQGRMAFEARVTNSAASYAASTSDYFVGLMDASGLPASAVPITATGGSLATAAGFIGFHKRGGATNGTDFNFVFNVAGGTPVYATNLQNIITTVLGVAPVGATYYKLGFVFDAFNGPLLPITSASTGQTASSSASRAMITVYVNGLRAAAFLTSTNVQGATFPITIMNPAIAWKQQSTTAAVNADCDWIMCAQTAVT
jgi:hypothetical protein